MLCNYTIHLYETSAPDPIWIEEFYGYDIDFIKELLINNCLCCPNWDMAKIYQENENGIFEEHSSYERYNREII